MTFRTSISSKGDPRKILRRGFKSMFADYEAAASATPPVDTQGERKRAVKLPPAA